jgi:hypothetical protein
MTSGRIDNNTIWRRYFRNILYSFWRNFGFFGRVFTLPCFACAAFVRSPRALCGAIADLAVRPVDADSASAKCL